MKPSRMNADRSAEIREALIRVHPWPILLPYTNPRPPTRGRAMPADPIPLPVIELRAHCADPAKSATADIQMTVAGRPVRLRLTVPTGPTPVRDLLPVFQGLANLVVNIAEENVHQAGEQIS